MFRNPKITGVLKILLLILLVPLYFVFYKLYFPKMLSFGCFDDCTAIATGYFINQGKHLYAEVFNNHQMGAMYLSALIQSITQPENLFELILRHRQTMWLASFLFALILTYRFGLVAFLTLIIYESSKFYLFGDRFLPEAIIIYMLIYLLGLVLNKFNNKKPSAADLFITLLFTWLIVFMREPYIPVAILLFFLVIWKQSQAKYLTGLMIIMSIIPFIYISFDDFWFNEVIFNLHTVFAVEVKSQNLLGLGLVKPFLYPLFVLFGNGVWNQFRIFLSVISIIYLILLILNLKLKNYSLKQIIMINFMLGLANIRFTQPGTVFFSAFHMLVWYGLTVFITLHMVSQLNLIKLKIFMLITIFLTGTWLFLQPGSFIWEKSDLQSDLLINYGRYLQYGNAITELSSPDNSFFSDGADEILYFITKLKSPYKYTWLISSMPQIPKYQNARREMFANNPPDFYYRFCSDEIYPDLFLPDNIKIEYVNIPLFGKPSCLYIKLSKFRDISDQQWLKAGELGFNKPI